MKKKPAPGFTLIEVLASVSVLLLLVVVTSQLVGAVSSIFRSGKARIEIFTQARMTFGALDRDIKQMVLRSDLAAFPKSGEKSAFAFYTRVQGREGDRAVSLVEYTLHDPITDADQSQPPSLIRRDYGMGFTSPATPRVMTFENSTTLPDLSNGNVQKMVLAPNVVRLDWRFVDAAGKVGNQFVFDYKDPTATTNTKVVQVALLVLDGFSYNLLVQPNQFPQFTDPVLSNGESCGQYWERQIDSGSLPPSLPKPVLKAIRVFERSFIIPVNR